MGFVNEALPNWLVVVAGLLAVLSAWLLHRYGHFRRRHVPYMKPLPILGNLAPITFKQSSFGDLIDTLYRHFDGLSFGGIYEFLNPVVLIRDPELIKLITVKDFDHFVDRRSAIASDVNPLFSKNVFSLRGQPWRDMRATLSPAFTSSKMKAMFALVAECGKQMGDYIEKQIEKLPDGSDKILSLEMKDFFTRYTNDVIATSAFGIQCDSHNDQTNDFYMMGKEVVNFGGLRSLIILGYIFSARLMRFLGISIIRDRVGRYFRFIIDRTVQQRERESIVRPDMIHLLMQARKGELKADATDEVDSHHPGQHHKKLVLSDEDVAAQAFIFFVAGFDTSSTLLCFVTNLLAVNPDLQERLQEEIDQVMPDHDQVSYEAVQKMKYLDMVISESLRLYPPAVATDRVCVKDYTIPATENTPEFTIRKGEGIWIPFFGLHRDPQYFPDPLKFDPERFSEENKHNIQPYTYLPFGVGPRNCIGMRFALMEAKVALVSLLSRFTISVIPKTPVPLKLTAKSFNMVVDGGFWVGYKLRKNSN